MADKSPFSEVGGEGLVMWDGHVSRDPKPELHGSGAVEQYDLMRLEDPTVASVLAALMLPIRRASWSFLPASDKAPDAEAAEYADSVIVDMSHTWDDHLTDVGSMFAFGWSYVEWVLKRRVEGKSAFTDGRVGFRKLALRGQSSLYKWEIDDSGGIQGMWQQTLEQPQPVLIPIEKALLYRTSREMNSPEGLSMLRPAYRDWIYKRALEKNEAKGLQMSQAGFAVITLGERATTRATHGENSDEAHAERIIKQIYDMRALGMIESSNITLRWAAPGMQGVTADSDRVIRRKDEGIARSALAMFILLGTGRTGSWALSKELGDLFYLSIDGYLQAICDVFNRFAVPVLMRYNTFPGISGAPELTASLSRRVDLEMLAGFLNKAVGAQVITPDEELEKYLREVADLPEPAIEVQVPKEERKPDTALEEGQEPEGSDQTPEQFRLRPGVQRFSKEKQYQVATDKYERDLIAAWDDWADETVGELVEAEADQFREKLDDRLAVGLLILMRLGWAALPAAFELGFGDPPSPDERRLVDGEIAANDQYLRDSLFKDVRGTLEGWIEAVLVLLQFGDTAGAEETLSGVLGAFRARVRKYAGQFWHSIHSGVVERVKAAPEERRVRWVVDPGAEHCEDCAKFEGTYDNIDALLAATGGILPGAGTQCDGNCRCHIEEEVARGVWVWM